MSASQRKEGIMDKLVSIRVLIAVAIVAVLGIGASVQAAGARPVDPENVVVPKYVKWPTTTRLPNERSSVSFSVPAWAQFIPIPGTNRYRAKSVHGGLDD
jgi:hypothetical protein